NEGRSVQNGYSPLGILAVPAIYSLPPTDFHAITLGSSRNYHTQPPQVYYSASTLPNMVTGLGTPIVAYPQSGGLSRGLIPDLIAYTGRVTLDPTLPTGTVGVGYDEPITASGGIGPKSLAYTIDSGAIPSGMAFTSTTSELDIIGTPT